MGKINSTAYVKLFSLFIWVTGLDNFPNIESTNMKRTSKMQTNQAGGSISQGSRERWPSLSGLEMVSVLSWLE